MYQGDCPRGVGSSETDAQFPLVCYIDVTVQQPCLQGDIKTDHKAVRVFRFSVLGFLMGNKLT